MLPDGFRYVSFGWTRDPMDDGVLTPPAHDGMAVVDAGHSRLVLVRNHEVRGRAAAYTPNRSITYDPNAGGGTTNLTFDIRQGQWHEAWSSLAGTTTNCAAGPRTPRAGSRARRRWTCTTSRTAGSSRCRRRGRPCRRRSRRWGASSTRRWRSTGRAASSTRPRTAARPDCTDFCPRTRTVSTRVGGFRC